MATKCRTKTDTSSAALDSEQTLRNKNNFRATRFAPRRAFQFTSTRRLAILEQLWPSSAKVGLRLAKSGDPNRHHVGTSWSTLGAQYEATMVERCSRHLVVPSAALPWGIFRERRNSTNLGPLFGARLRSATFLARQARPPPPHRHPVSCPIQGLWCNWPLARISSRKRVGYFVWGRICACMTRDLTGTPKPQFLSRFAQLCPGSSRHKSRSRSVAPKMVKIIWTPPPCSTESAELGSTAARRSTCSPARTCLAKSRIFVFVCFLPSRTTDRQGR